MSGKANLHDIFEFGEQLGKGTFATVVMITDRATSKKYAMKIVEKHKAKGIEDQIIKEISILKRIQHKNIIRLYDCFETKTKYYIQMEYVDGGELFDRIVNLGFYSEEDARAIIKSVLEAVKYLHDNNIVHRDLKPENLLLATKDDNCEVKLADFGLSTVIEQDHMLKTSCGTLTYCAPEVLKRKKYGKSVDLWSIGIITYVLLSGYPPFWSHDDNQLRSLVIKGEYQYFSPEWDEITDAAKDFIRCLIEPDISKRLTCHEALRHPWIMETGQKINLNRVASNLVLHFNAKRKLKSGFGAIKFAIRTRNTSIISTTLRKASESVAGSETSSISSTIPRNSSITTDPALSPSDTTAQSKSASHSNVTSRRTSLTANNAIPGLETIPGSNTPSFSSKMSNEAHREKTI